MLGISRCCLYLCMKNWVGVGGLAQNSPASMAGAPLWLLLAGISSPTYS